MWVRAQRSDIGEGAGPGSGPFGWLRGWSLRGHGTGCRTI
jgi:hypothetical protein